MQKVKAIQDSDSHWYVIPNDLISEFTDLDAKISNDDSEYDSQEIFSEKFEHYRTGGDLNNIQLYADIK